MASPEAVATGALLLTLGAAGLTLYTGCTWWDMRRRLRRCQADLRTAQTLTARQQAFLDHQLIADVENFVIGREGDNGGEGR